MGSGGFRGWGLAGASGRVIKGLVNHGEKCKLHLNDRSCPCLPAIWSDMRFLVLFSFFFNGIIHYVVSCVWLILLSTFFVCFFCLFFLNVLWILFIYLFLAVLGLRFCARAFSSCGKRGPLFTAARGPLTIAASLVAEHRLQTCRIGSCGSRA